MHVHLGGQLDWDGERREDWKVSAILLVCPHGVAIPQLPLLTFFDLGGGSGHHLGKQVALKVLCDSPGTQGEEPQLPQARPGLPKSCL